MSLEKKLQELHQTREQIHRELTEIERSKLEHVKEQAEELRPRLEEAKQKLEKIDSALAAFHNAKEKGSIDRKAPGKLGNGLADLLLEVDKLSKDIDKKLGTTSSIGAELPDITSDAQAVAERSSEDILKQLSTATSVANAAKNKLVSLGIEPELIKKIEDTLNEAEVFEVADEKDANKDFPRVFQELKDLAKKATRKAKEKQQKDEDEAYAMREVERKKQEEQAREAAFEQAETADPFDPSEKSDVDTTLVEERQHDLDAASVSKKAFDQLKKDAEAIKAKNQRGESASKEAEEERFIVNTYEKPIVLRTGEVIQDAPIIVPTGILPPDGEDDYAINRKYGELSHNKSDKWPIQFGVEGVKDFFVTDVSDVDNRDRTGTLQFKALYWENESKEPKEKDAIVMKVSLDYDKDAELRRHSGNTKTYVQNMEKKITDISVEVLSSKADKILFRDRKSLPKNSGMKEVKKFLKDAIESGAGAIYKQIHESQLMSPQTSAANVEAAPTPPNSSSAEAEPNNESEHTKGPQYGLWKTKTKKQRSESGEWVDVPVSQQLDLKFFPISEHVHIDRDDGIIYKGGEKGHEGTEVLADMNIPGVQEFYAEQRPYDREPNNNGKGETALKFHYYPSKEHTKNEDAWTIDVRVEYDLPENGSRPTWKDRFDWEHTSGVIRILPAKNIANGVRRSALTKTEIPFSGGSKGLAEKLPEAKEAMEKLLKEHEQKALAAAKRHEERTQAKTERQEEKTDKTETEPTETRSWDEFSEEEKGKVWDRLYEYALVFTQRKYTKDQALKDFDKRLVLLDDLKKKFGIAEDDFHDVFNEWWDEVKDGQVPQEKGERKKTEEEKEVIFNALDAFIEDVEKLERDGRTKQEIIEKFANNSAVKRVLDNFEVHPDDRKKALSDWYDLLEDSDDAESEPKTDAEKKSSNEFSWQSLSKEQQQAFFAALERNAKDQDMKAIIDVALTDDTRLDTFAQKFLGTSLHTDEERKEFKNVLKAWYKVYSEQKTDDSPAATSEQVSAKDEHAEAMEAWANEPIAPEHMPKLVFNAEEQKAIEEMAEELGESGELADLKATMEQARTSFLVAKENLDGLGGKLRKLFTKKEKIQQAQEMYDEALQEYTEARDAYVEGSVLRLYKEHEHLLNHQIREQLNLKNKDIGRKIVLGIRQMHDALGRINLNKGKSQEEIAQQTILGRAVRGVVSARTAVYTGLSALGAVGLGLKKTFTGVATGSITYDFLQRYAREKRASDGLLQPITAEELKEHPLEIDDVHSRIQAIQAQSELDGVALDDEKNPYKPQYEVLKAEYIRLLEAMSAEEQKQHALMNMLKQTDVSKENVILKELKQEKKRHLVIAGASGLTAALGLPELMKEYNVSGKLGSAATYVGEKLGIIDAPVQSATVDAISSADAASAETTPEKPVYTDTVEANHGVSHEYKEFFEQKPEMLKLFIEDGMDEKTNPEAYARLQALYQKHGGDIGKMMSDTRAYGKGENLWKLIADAHGEDIGLKKGAEVVWDEATGKLRFEMPDGSNGTYEMVEKSTAGTIRTSGAPETAPEAQVGVLNHDAKATVEKLYDEGIKQFHIHGDTGAVHSLGIEDIHAVTDNTGQKVFEGKIDGKIVRGFKVDGDRLVVPNGESLHWMIDAKPEEIAVPSDAATVTPNSNGFSLTFADGRVMEGMMVGPNNTYVPGPKFEYYSTNPDTALHKVITTAESSPGAKTAPAEAVSASKTASVPTEVRSSVEKATTSPPKTPEVASPTPDVAGQIELSGEPLKAFGRIAENTFADVLDTARAGVTYENEDLLPAVDSVKAYFDRPDIRIPQEIYDAAASGNVDSPAFKAALINHLRLEGAVDQKTTLLLQGLDSDVSAKVATDGSAVLMRDGDTVRYIVAEEGQKFDVNASGQVTITRNNGAPTIFKIDRSGADDVAPPIPSAT